MRLGSVADTARAEIVSEPSPSRSESREAQRLATRERLIEVGVEELRRHGLTRMEVARVVQRAGVSRGTFYFHFPSKEDLLGELCLREERRIVEEVAPLVEREAPLREILRAIVSGVVHAEDRLGVGLVRDICAMELRSTMTTAAGVAEHPMATLVLEAVGKGRRETEAGSADMAIIFLVGMFGLLATHDGPSVGRQQLIETLIGLTEQGVSVS